MTNDLIKTKGIIIQEVKEKEFDKLLTVLTLDYGKIKVWANGCRKPTSKNIGKTKLFVFGNFELKFSKFGYNLSFLEPINYFDKIALDSQKTFYGFYFLEVIDYVCVENLEAEDLVKLLYYTLKALESEKIDKELIKSIFELKVLQFNGTYTDSNNISSQIQYTWNYVLDKTPEKVYNFNLAPNLLTEFSKEVEKDFNKYIEKKFNSRRYLG